MRTPSLAEQCYLAYWRGWPALPLPFARLSQRERRAWAQAARGVVAAWQAQELGHGTRNGQTPLAPPEQRW